MEVARTVNGVWEHETVSNDPATSGTVRLDATGAIHVAYRWFDASGGVSAFYATNAMGAWQTTQLTDTANGDADINVLRMEIDAVGVVHVIHDSDLLAPFVHHRLDGGTWTSSVLSPSGRYLNAGLGVDGKIFAFWDEQGFVLAQWDGDAWTVSPAEPDIKTRPAVAQNATGTFLVAHEDSSVTTVLSVVDASGVETQMTDLEFATDPIILHGPDGVHPFVELTTSFGQRVGFAYLYRQRDRWVHSEMQVNSLAEIYRIDTQGRLHYVDVSLNRHYFSPTVDTNCNGEGW